MKIPARSDPGTVELEKGMRSGKASHVAAIAAIVFALLATFNAGGLARWTQALPSSETNLWVAERAFEWQETMTRLGPARWFETLRARLRGE